MSSWGITHRARVVMGDHSPSSCHHGGSLTELVQAPQPVCVGAPVVLPGRCDPAGPANLSRVAPLIAMSPRHKANASTLQRRVEVSSAPADEWADESGRISACMAIWSLLSKCQCTTVCGVRESSPQYYTSEFTSAVILAPCSSRHNVIAGGVARAYHYAPAP